MTMIKLVITSFLLTLASAASLAQEPGKTITSSKIDDVKWLAGCWELNDLVKQLQISEQWMAPAGGVMIGMSRTVRNGKMTGFEYMRIERDLLSLRFISKPSQNSVETTFRIFKWSANEVVFANPAHDFPQRIIYKLTKPDSLTARIEGMMNGKFLGIDFPMDKVKCS